MIKSIPLTLHRNYCSKWSSWESIREILQNALDHGDYDIQYNPSESELIIRSKNVTLPEGILILGNGSKRDDSSQRGQYGEGLKLSMLVLLREGYSIDIINGKHKWTPKFRYNPDFDCECLYVDVGYISHDAPEEFTYIIKGITQQDIEMVADRFIPSPSHAPEPPVAVNNGRFAFESDKPSIFVGGLFVCHLPKRNGKSYKYSYNLNPEDVELDRDRGTVDDWSVAWEATKLFRDSQRWDILAELAAEDANDINDYMYSGHSSFPKDAMKDIVHHAQKTFFKRHGSKAQPIDGGLSGKDLAHAIEDAKDAGYEPVIVKRTLYNMLPEKVREQRVVGKERKSVIQLLEEFKDNHQNILTEEANIDIMGIIETVRILHG